MLDLPISVTLSGNSTPPAFSIMSNIQKSTLWDSESTYHRLSVWISDVISQVNGNSRITWWLYLMRRDGQAVFVQRTRLDCWGWRLSTWSDQFVPPLPDCKNGHTYWQIGHLVAFQSSGQHINCSQMPGQDILRRLCRVTQDTQQFNVNVLYTDKSWNVNCNANCRFFLLKVLFKCFIREHIPAFREQMLIPMRVSNVTMTMTTKWRHCMTYDPPTTPPPNNHCVVWRTLNECPLPCQEF